ncbi:type II secretion system F family protein [Gimesia chilikensis]|jgi:tight adherence protein C|uniref:Bacterial type II secretion system protein F domain protein n=1 Tax=Gimesia chilikensis TaxID=2605989 RepID=A0A517PU46_9PLAN|nr:type II secretion system F family protein [Gimesia chilikensis]MCR9233417.1 type II secretion system F family protein [bacterium]QDT22896.1 Bacterial type II secretion system protein F domain protein [Gimesia chilikensis]QDT86803.1 Bacterial type II secretion system protein F domain protein [Gimesia chilikensis]
MDYVQLLPWAIFGMVIVGVIAVVNKLSSDKSRANERLDELRNPHLRNGGEEGASASSLLEKAAPTLSKALTPKSELEENQLKVRLANAGYNSENAPSIFLSLKVTLGLLGVLIGSGYGFYNFGLTQNGWTSLVIAGGIGFYLPEIVLRFMCKARIERIFLSLPDALDLLVVCVEAGLGLDAAMRRVSEELEETAPDVCNEFALCNLQLQMGRPRREVLHDLGIRSGVDDMRALSAILIQADKFGSSIAQALRVQSDSMRVKRSQLAEEQAAMTAVKMIFPLVLFIFPGIFVVLVGPAAIMMINGLLSS